MNEITAFINNYSLEIVVGIISGVALIWLQWVMETIRNAILFSQSKYKKYLGTYYTYSFSTTGSGEVFEGKLYIKQRLGKLYVEEENVHFKYIGAINFSERNIFIKMRGTGHPEEVLYVFHYPLTGVIRKLIGVAACVTGANEPCAFRILISNKEIDEQTARQELLRYEDKKNRNIIRVPIDITIYEDNKNNPI